MTTLSTTQSFRKSYEYGILHISEKFVVACGTMPGGTAPGRTFNGAGELEI